MNRATALLSGFVVVSALGLAAPAMATPVTWTSVGSCSEACAATATITAMAGKLEVVLTDTQANPHSAGDLLSGVYISLGGSLGTPTLFSQAGTLITVNDATAPYTTTAGPPTHWGVGISSANCAVAGNCIALETAGPFAVGGKPINMIIGPGDASGDYTNANASITKTSNGFNPFIDGTGTFFITDSAITTSTVITGVTFAFGTTPDTFLRGIDPPPLSAPEPITLSIFGVGLAGVAGMRRRKAKGA